MFKHRKGGARVRELGVSKRLCERHSAHTHERDRGTVRERENARERERDRERDG